MDRPVRVVLDVNIFVSSLMAQSRGHEGTASQTLVSMASSHKWGLTGRSQLIVSFEMIDTLEIVLSRLQFPEQSVKAYTSALIDVMKYGPDSLDPYLILGGEERFAMPDAEDVGVLAAAFGAGADMIVTDNIRDFVSKDAMIVETQTLPLRPQGQRKLQVLRYRIGTADLIVAHPFDVLNWMRAGFDFKPSALWKEITDS